MGKNERDIKYQEDSSTLVGKRKRELVDKDTGEIMEVEQITKLVYGSKNFWKCYLKEFLAVLKELNDRQFKVFIYIVGHIRPSDNLFIGTYGNIIKGVGCCRQTVATTMKKLQEFDFIKKVHIGVWIINPDIIMKGNDRKRHKLLSDYSNVESIETDKFVKNKTGKKRKA